MPGPDQPRLASARGSSIAGFGVGLAVAAVVYAPMVGPGWLQLLDWATGPEWPQVPVRPSLTAGPAFAALVTICRAVGGAAVGWLVPALAQILASVGTARLVGGHWSVAALAALAYVWNPFVFDRIYSGQFAFLLGYALVPWLAAAAWDRRPRPPVGLGLRWAIAVGASVHFAWIGAVVLSAAAPAARRRHGTRSALRALSVSVVAAAAISALWVVPARGEVGAGRGTEQVLESFATRADPDLGRTAGLAAQQGFWRPAPISPRTQLGRWFTPLAGATVALAVLGLAFPPERLRAVARPAALAAVVGLLLAHGAAGPVGSLYRVAWSHLPGFAVMREAQKFASLVSLASAIGIASAVARLHEEAPGRSRLTNGAVTAVAGLLVVGFTPTLAGGLGGQVEPSPVPASAEAIRQHLDDQPGTAIAVPWDLYTSTIPSGGRVVAAPAQALFGDRVEWSRDPALDGFADDDPWRTAVARALADGSDEPSSLGPRLRRLGVRWVVELVDPQRSGPDLSGAGLEPVIADPAVRLWRVD